MFNEQEIFARALKIDDVNERARFLDGACGEDIQLRRRIEDDLNRAFYQIPVTATGGVSGPEPPAPEDGTLAATKDIVSAPFEGQQIGPYRLREKIGEGGFGIVYLAEQTEPVRRRVALKVIKPGMDSREVIARFEAERQALALMDHPNIARVIDAGTTETGRPYFVMELVRGVSLTLYCDDARLDVTQRLQLFIDICRAVQHAHQKGIIHRDLKPGNVLVTQVDGKPTVKVIDFGVAKAVHQQLADATVYTRFAQMIGTPLYMSPEQAEMSNQDIDTRSDIYSLGVILYELLTGSTPFGREQLMQAALDEMRRIIREVEPPKPSTRLSESGDRLPSIAAQRHTEPLRLSRLLRGDLDWIVMKSLEKSRKRRYATASEFADDIERHLQHEPVQAAPPSMSYRLARFVRKHRNGVTAVGILFLALFAGLVSSLWLFARSEFHRNNALKNGSELATSNKELQSTLAQLTDRSAELGQALREKSSAFDKQAAALKRAEALRLTAQSTAALRSDPALGILLAIEAAGREPNLSVVNQALVAACEACNELRTFELGQQVERAIFSNDKQLVAVVGWDNSVHIVETMSGKKLLELPALKSMGLRIYPEFSDDGDLLLLRFEGYQVLQVNGTGKCSFTDRVARVFDVQSGREIAVLRHEERVSDIEFVGATRQFVTSSLDGVIRVWTEKGELVASHQMQSGPEVIDAAAVAPKRTFEVETPAGPPSVLAIDVDRSGKFIAVLLNQPVITGSLSNDYPDEAIVADNPPVDVLNAAASPIHGGSTSMQLQGAQLSQPVRVVELETGKTIHSFPIDRFDAGKSVSFVGQQNLVAVGTGLHCLLVFDSNREKLVFKGQLAVKSAGDCELPELEEFLDEAPGSVNLLTGFRRSTLRDFAAQHKLEVDKLVSLISGHPFNSATDEFLIPFRNDLRLYSLFKGAIPAQVFPGHRAPIVASCFLGSGLLATIGDSTLRIWAMNECDFDRQLFGHTDIVNGACFSPDGQLLATWSNDKTVTIRASTNFRQIGTLSRSDEKRGDRLANAFGPILSARFSPDGSRLASIAEDPLCCTIETANSERQKLVPFEPLNVWRLDSLDRKLGIEGTIVRTSENDIYPFAFSDMAWSDNGQTLITTDSIRYRIDGDQSGSGSVHRLDIDPGSEQTPQSRGVRIWDSATGRLTRVIPGTGESFISRDGNWAIVNEDGSWSVYKVDQAVKVSTLDVAAGSHALENALFSPDGRWVLVRQFNFPGLFSVADGRRVGQGNLIGSDAPFMVFSCAFTPDSQHLVLGLENGDVQIISVSDWRPLATLRGHRKPVNHICFDAMGRRMATTSDDGSARIWDLTSLQEWVVLLPRTGESLRGSVFSPDGKWLVTWSGEISREGWSRKVDNTEGLLSGNFAVKATVGLPPFVRVWPLNILDVARSRKPRELTPEERKRFLLEPSSNALPLNEAK